MYSLPDRPASVLVLSGPYRFTRNPMYLSLTVVYLGVSVLMQSLWSLMLLPLVLFFIRSKVIDREERMGVVAEPSSVLCPG